MFFKYVEEKLIDSNESRDIEVSLRLGDRCKNLIRFYGALSAEDHYLILTEAMDTSLDCLYKKIFQLNLRPPTPFYSLIAQSVLNALCYMKEQRLMHRDIKPSNILLNSTGEIKVCDYGISGFLNQESLCNSYIGDAIYMSVSVLLSYFLIFIKKLNSEDRYLNYDDQNCNFYNDTYSRVAITRMRFKARFKNHTITCINFPFNTNFQKKK